MNEDSFGTLHSPAAIQQLRAVCDAYRHFLDASIGLGRSLWTQYDTGLMCWGLAVLSLSTLSICLRLLVAEAAREAAAAASAAGGGGGRPTERRVPSVSASGRGAGHLGLLWGLAGERRGRGAGPTARRVVAGGRGVRCGAIDVDRVRVGRGLLSPGEGCQGCVL